MKQNSKVTAKAKDREPVATQVPHPQAIAVTFQGPLPSSLEMRGYADINPELPMRIMAMAEKQAAHRQSLEKKAIEAQIRSQRLGQIFAFILGIIGMICGTISAVYGSPWTGVAEFIGSLAVLLWAFIYVTKSNRAERERKWTEAQPK